VGAWLSEESDGLKEKLVRALPFLLDCANGHPEILSYLLPGLINRAREDGDILRGCEEHSIPFTSMLRFFLQQTSETDIQLLARTLTYHLILEFYILFLTTKPQLSRGILDELPYCITHLSTFLRLEEKGIIGLDEFCQNKLSLVIVHILSGNSNNDVFERIKTVAPNIELDKVVHQLFVNILSCFSKEPSYWLCAIEAFVHCMQEYPLLTKLICKEGLQKELVSLCEQSDLATKTGLVSTINNLCRT